MKFVNTIVCITLLYIILPCSYTFASSFAAKHTNSLIKNNNTKLGTLTDFYKGQVVVGPWLSGGQGLITIPKYMEETDFPYQKRPYEKEVPLADRLIMVRFLGGWNDKGKNSTDLPPGDIYKADLFYVNHDGSIALRSKQIRNRLDPYVSRGYKNITIVLDNVPWSLFKDPVKLYKTHNQYGQFLPPPNYNQWEQGVKLMAKYIIKTYPQLRGHLSFRVGTENETRGKFNGTQEQYFKMYQFAYKGIHEALGNNFNFYPFNITHLAAITKGINLSNLKKMQLNVPPTKLAKFIKDKQLPWDTIASSFYFVARKDENGIRGNNPIKKVSRTLKAYQIIQNALGKNHKDTWEIQEFGALFHAGWIRQGTVSAYSAAQLFLSAMLLYEGGFDHIYHWRMFRNMGPNLRLLKGLGWAYTVLDHSLGGKLFRLQTEIMEPNLNNEKVQQHAWGVVKNDNLYVYAVVSSPNVKFHKQVKMKIALPHEFFTISNHPSIKQVHLDRTTSVFNIIRKDLQKQGLLKPEYISHPYMVSRVKYMAGEKGMAYVRDNYRRYANLIRNSLTFKPYKGELIRGIDHDSLVYNAQVPAIYVLKLPLHKK